MHSSRLDFPIGIDQRGVLGQFKKLAEQFEARETWQGIENELRILPTPVDRYVPGNQPNSDGAIFAFVQGVNPEALLLLETDGKNWNYCWGRLSAAAVTAKLDGKVVWAVDVELARAVPTAAYSCIYDTAVIPAEFDSDDAPKP